MLTVRLSKILLLFSIANFCIFTLINQYYEYNVSFEAVKHVLMMDTVNLPNIVNFRSITNLNIITAALWLIILSEALCGILCLIGCFHMLLNLKSGAKNYNQAKKFGVAGLTVGIILWQVGFMTIGGDWFEMWLSPTWNAVEPSFRLIIIFAVILIYLTIKDEEL
jgi:predicted small integral membrane protein